MNYTEEHNDNERLVVRINKEFDLHIVKTDEGYVIDCYTLNKEGKPVEDDVVATTWFFDSDLESEEDGG